MHGWLPLFIFAWPFALVFLLFCFPDWRGGRALRGSAFALLFWSEWSMLHHGGFGCAMYRIYHFTVQMKRKHVY
jgi:hypothetical protein